MKQSEGTIHEKGYQLPVESKSRRTSRIGTKSTLKRIWKVYFPITNTTKVSGKMLGRG